MGAVEVAVAQGFARNVTGDMAGDIAGAGRR
jgi:hypothetical protein